MTQANEQIGDVVDGKMFCEVKLLFLSIESGGFEQSDTTEQKQRNEDLSLEGSFP